MLDPGLVTVKVPAREVALDINVVVAIAEQCLEWVEAQGFSVTDQTPGRADDRSYAELANDFAADL